MTRLRSGDLWRMAVRSSVLQATWNYERQQGLGWAWALKPALDRLYPDPAERRLRLAEHTAYFNTQPTLASLAIGAAACLEERRAQGEGPDADTMSRIKAVLASSLAAIGDRLFWFTLRPFAACLGALLALGGSHWGALAMWLCYNAIHLTMRLLGVGWGYRGGPGMLSETLRARLERLASGLGIAGSALIGMVVAVTMVRDGNPRPILFQLLFALGLAGGLVTAQRPRPSPTVWALGIGLATLLVVWFRRG